MYAWLTNSIQKLQPTDTISATLEVETYQTQNTSFKYLAQIVETVGQMVT